MKEDGKFNIRKKWPQFIILFPKRRNMNFSLSMYSYVWTQKFLERFTKLLFK